MPRAVPAFMMPMAVERSFTGNHSATTRVAAGKPPPSPAPSSSRQAASMPKLVASPWPAQASDQNTMMIVKPRRVPSASMQPSARRVHEGVGDQEGRLQQRELLVRDGDVPLDGLDGDGQRLPVQVADGDGRADQDGDPPAQRGRLGALDGPRSPLQHDERDRLAGQRERHRDLALLDAHGGRALHPGELARGLRAPRTASRWARSASPSASRPRRRCCGSRRSGSAAGAPRRSARGSPVTVSSTAASGPGTSSS